jgi:hypothetical protein
LPTPSILSASSLEMTFPRASFAISSGEFIFGRIWLLLIHPTLRRLSIPLVFAGGPAVLEFSRSYKIQRSQTFRTLTLVFLM